MPSFYFYRVTLFTAFNQTAKRVGERDGIQRVLTEPFRSDDAAPQPIRDRRFYSKRGTDH